MRNWKIGQKQMFYMVLFVLTLPQVILCFTEHMSLAAGLCQIVLPFSVYYWIMSRVRNVGKGTWLLFPFIFLGAFQIVLLYLFGKSVIAVDMFLNLVTTNPTEAFELLDNLWPVLVFIAVLYIPVLVVVTIQWIRKQDHPAAFLKQQRKYSGIALLCGFLTLPVAFLCDRRYEVRSDLFPVNVCYNMYLAVQRTQATRNYQQTSRGFSYHAVSHHNKDRKEVYVLVVGETARACNWSLYGYERPTNPCLSVQRGLVAFPHVLSESNTTHKSVPMLLSSISAENFDSIYYRKGIITAFKEAGFQTAFFSNQRRNHSFIDFFGMEADRYDFIKEDSLGTMESNPHDQALLSCVTSCLQRGARKQLIVLHLYGSHFNYRERYAPMKPVFSPDTPDDADKKNRSSLLHAYDNTLYYTDRFLASLMGMLQKQQCDAALLYTSDHGEDIFDDDRGLFLHASPVPSYYQMHVPFIAWLSDSYREHYPEVWQILRSHREKNISSSASFFHTMLDIAGISSPYRNDSLSVAHRKFTERRRVYLDDHNEAKPLDDIGLDEEDFIQFRKHGIGCLP